MLYRMLLLSLCCGLGHGAYNHPVIGIFMQNSFGILQPFADMFLSPHYVKFIEQAGALVVPIKLKQPVSYYQNLFTQINGILYPGDRVFQMQNDYTFAGKLMWDMAIKANDYGTYFPLFGISEGNEMLNYFSPQHRHNHRTDTYLVSLPLVFEHDFRQSRLLKNMPGALVDALQNTALAPNRHQYSLMAYPNGTDESDAFFRVLSYSQDKNGQDFVSTMEANRYPFYGLHWSVDRLNFELLRTTYNNHTSDGALVSQYFANFFVNEARKNNHQFKNNIERIDSLVENLPFLFMHDGHYLEDYLANYTRHYTVIG